VTHVCVIFMTREPFLKISVAKVNITPHYDGDFDNAYQLPTLH